MFISEIILSSSVKLNEWSTSASLNFLQFTLGSDDELAVKKCFSHYFPRSLIVICSLHQKRAWVGNWTSCLEVLQLNGRNRSLRCLAALV